MGSPSRCSIKRDDPPNVFRHDGKPRWLRIVASIIVAKESGAGVKAFAPCGIRARRRRSKGREPLERNL